MTFNNLVKFYSYININQQVSFIVLNCIKKLSNWDEENLDAMVKIDLK